MNDIIDVKNVLCPVKWKCVKLQREICSSEEAVYDANYGWICDCGVHVKLKSTKYHYIIEKNYRNAIRRTREKQRKRH